MHSMVHCMQSADRLEVCHSLQAWRDNGGHAFCPIWSRHVSGKQCHTLSDLLACDSLFRPTLALSLFLHYSMSAILYLLLSWQQHCKSSRWYMLWRDICMAVIPDKSDGRSMSGSYEGRSCKVVTGVASGCHQAAVYGAHCTVHECVGTQQ